MAAKAKRQTTAPKRKQAQAAKKPVARKASPRRAAAMPKPAQANAPRTTRAPRPAQLQSQNAAESIPGFPGFDAFTNMMPAMDNSDPGQAYARCCNVIVSGMEDLMKYQSTFFQQFAEKQMKYINDSLQVRTLNEWTETQHEIAQENLNDLMDMATRSSERCVKIASEAFEPLNEELNKFIRQTGQAAA